MPIGCIHYEGLVLRKDMNCNKFMEMQSKSIMVTKQSIKESPVFSEQDKTLLGKPETVKEIKHKMQRMEQRGIRFCSQESEAFPKKLRYIPDPPYALFYRGMLPDTDRPAIAIVGGRNTGYESREIAAGFGRQLAENGIAVVSGFARVLTSVHKRVL